MCNSRFCPDLVGQPFIPSDSSFLKVMMNKEFWGFFSYFDQLSVALNTIMLGGLLWIYQEDPESVLRYSRIPWK